MQYSVCGGGHRCGTEHDQPTSHQEVYGRNRTTIQAEEDNSVWILRLRQADGGFRRGLARDYALRPAQ